jgi:hypothetical protein
MRPGFLDHIFPHRALSAAAVWVWIAFFLLFPLAYLGGTLLHQEKIHRNFSTMRMDRAAAIATARQFVSERGIDATSWRAYATVDPSDKLVDYFRLNRDKTAQSAQSFSLPVKAHILLVSGTGEIAEVILDPSLRVAGYDLTRVKSATSAAPVDTAKATAIATAATANIPNLTSVLSLGTPETGTLEHTPGGNCRNFAWNAAAPNLPGLKFDISTAVCGTQPVRQLVKTTLDSDYAKAHSLGTNTAVDVLIIVYSVYVVIVVLYSLYRYARRSFEREVSHARTLLLATLISIVMVGSFLTAFDEYVIGGYKNTQSIQWYPLVAVAIGLTLLGFIFALSYEAGEGDAREMSPAKMTSLDALLRGKLFSRNVARSVLFGAAFGGWVLLAQGLLNRALGVDSGAHGTQILQVVFFRFPALAITIGQITNVTWLPASGLLLPLGFLHRNIRRAGLRNAMFVLCVVLACLINVRFYTSLTSAAVGTVVLAATLLGPLLVMDFLAVMVSIGAFMVAMALAGLAVLAPSSTPVGMVVVVVALAFLGIEAWAAVRGREFHDEEVRPLYARHMAERQLLQAEMAAAREAQLHLLPKAAPEIRGLSISAACIPAHIVGGDFYDFFPLSDSRLGVFIAEGGTRGIGSALTIALAKGFLMHTVRQNLAPHEIIIRLEAALGTFLESVVATTHVAYAVIDTNVGHIRYARTGEYPKVLVSSSLATERKLDIPGTDKVVYEGMADLRGGDTVMLFTAGIARKVRTTGSRASEEILRVLKRKRREHELDDDLTAVVVSVTRIAAAMEGVA